MWTISSEPDAQEPDDRDGDLYRAEISNGADKRTVWIEASGSLAAPPDVVRDALARWLLRDGPPPARLFLSTPPDETMDPPYTVRVAY